MMTAPTTATNWAVGHLACLLALHHCCPHCEGRRKKPPSICPLCPKSGQISRLPDLSALCQKQTFALQQIFLFDHLVGEREQLLGNLQDLLRGATRISADALAC